MFSALGFRKSRLDPDDDPTDTKNIEEGYRNGEYFRQEYQEVREECIWAE